MTTIELTTPSAQALPAVIDALRGWQRDGASVPLHPGDLGWFQRCGAAACAAAVRVWRRDGIPVAIGLLDGADLLRIGLAPEALEDRSVAERIAADAGDPARGVLPPGAASVEVREGPALRDALGAAGWAGGERWIPLRRDLAAPVADPGVRVEVVGDALVAARTAVQRSAFAGSVFTDERWHDMAAGAAYRDARCLLVLDGAEPAGAVTVWSAGPGRPGLIEPLAVHPGHRGRGLGRATTIAAAAALRALGASSATVATPSTNDAAVATYVSAGFVAGTPLADLTRAA